MQNIIDRLEMYMTYRGLNDNQVTVQAGLSVGQIGKARLSRKGLHSDSIEKLLCAFEDLNPIWFVLGKGDMLLVENAQKAVKEVKEVSNRPDLIQLLSEKDNKIIELATKIGKLEQQVELLKKENPQAAYRFAAEP